MYIKINMPNGGGGNQNQNQGGGGGGQQNQNQGGGGGGGGGGTNPARRLRLDESVATINNKAKQYYDEQNEILDLNNKNRLIDKYRKYYKIGLIITLIISFISLILLFTGWELNKNRSTDFNGVSYANFGFTGTLVLFLAFVIFYYHNKENMNGLWNYKDKLGKNLSRQITIVKESQAKDIENLEKTLHKNDRTLNEVVKKLKTGTIYKDGQAAAVKNNQVEDLDSVSQLKYMLGQ